MVTATEYNKALKRLMELNNLYIVPGDREDLEQQHLVDLITQYEAEQDAEGQGEHAFMVQFEDRFLASMER
jgi:hypothetical protein